MPAGFTYVAVQHNVFLQSGGELSEISECHPGDAGVAERINYGKLGSVGSVRTGCSVGVWGFVGGLVFGGHGEATCEITTLCLVARSTNRNSFGASSSYAHCNVIMQTLMIKVLVFLLPTLHHHRRIYRQHRFH